MIEKYLSGQCPKCDSTDVENVGDYDYPDGHHIIAEHVHCNKCGCDFTETYTLIAQEVIG